MHASRIAFVSILATVAGCAGAPKPKVFGTSSDLTPTVEILGNDRMPLHLRITQAQASYVAAFYVVPGEGTRMLFPVDSSGSKLLPAGAQEITTAFATRPGSDSSRLLRRSPRAGQQPGGNSGIPQDRSPGENRGANVQQESFVLVYASRDSLGFKALNDRVIGVSLPGYNDEAFNTVTKLIRAAASGSGPWSAVAVPFRP